MRIVALIFCIIFFTSACQRLATNGTNEETNTESVYCSFSDDNVKDESHCNITPWLDYWLDVSQLNWQERQQIINDIGTPKSLQDELKLVLLNSAADTPYRSRLRAQSYARRIIKMHNGPLSTFIEHIVYHPAQKRLELESAVSTLERKNKSYQEKISELNGQVQQLLNIEKRLLVKPVEEQN